MDGNAGDYGALPCILDLRSDRRLREWSTCYRMEPKLDPWFYCLWIMFLCLVIYSIVWKSNFHFAFLPDYIQLSTQVLAKSEQHMPYRTVQDVVVRQGILERMFGLATVFIQNAASISVPRSGGRGAIASQAMNIPGQTLEGANKIAEIVRSVSLTRNSTGTGL